MPIIISGQSFPIQVLNVNNGLSSGTVECALFDSKGFLWVGTREGLHRYDGKNVVRYLPDPTDPGAISSSFIYGMTVDHYGQIWIKGDNGLDIFLPADNCFEHLVVNTYDDFGGLPLIWLVDSLDIGILPSLSGPNQSIVVSLRERRFISQWEDLSPAVKKIISSFWLHTVPIEHYLPEKDSIVFDFRKYFNEKKDEMVRISRDNDGLWFYTKQKGGFTKLKHGQKEGEWKPVHHDWPEIEKNSLMSMMDYNDSLGLAGLVGYGAILFHKSSGRVIRSWDFRQDPALSRKSEIKWLTRDQRGRVWFSLMPYGVFVFNPLSPRFQLLKNGTASSILHQGLIRSLMCDTLGRLWIGYHDGHVQILDPEIQNELFRFDMISDRNAVKYQASTIDPFPDGTIWINNKVSVREHKGVFTKNTFDIYDSLNIESIHHIFHRPQKTAVLYGIPPNELYVFQADHHFSRQLPRGIPLPFKCADIGGNKFFFSCSGNSFGVLTITDADTCEITDRRRCDFNITGIYHAPNSDSIWMATNKGLKLYHHKTFAFDEIPTQNWPSQFLYGILPDERGNLWISSNAGLIRYNPATQVTRFIGVSEGMQSNEFNTNCYAVLNDGSLAFAGPEGLNVFHPSYFDDREAPYYVYVSSASINEKDVASINPFASDFSLTLHPQDKSIEIHYGAAKYLERTGLQYFVQLEGAESDWVNRGEQESVRYINLKPKTYQLRIKAKDGTGQWSRNEIKGTIVVQPSFFQTKWFALLCIGSITGILYLLYRYRIRQLKKIMDIRNRIGRDLHDDIGSTLGSISIYSEVAKSTSNEIRTDVLDKIGDASREMLEKLNDIVWSINPENDTVVKMEKRMRSYAAMILNPLNIEFDLQLNTNDPTNRLAMDHRRNLFLIFKEALHNAVKYSHCKQISILLEEEHGQVRMEIRDDGIGFDPLQTNGYNGNGLNSMRERAKSIHAHLSIESKPGHGTKILIHQK